MSTVKAANLQNTGSGAPTFKNSSGTEIGQLCRAWVNFNGQSSTAVIRSSFNVSSITDEAAGDYTVNFTNAMSDADYCVCGAVSDTATGAGYRWLAVGSDYGSNFSKTTSGVRVQAVYQSDTKQQAAHVYVVIFGD